MRDERWRRGQIGCRRRPCGMNVELQHQSAVTTAEGRDDESERWREGGHSSLTGRHRHGGVVPAFPSPPPLLPCVAQLSPAWGQFSSPLRCFPLFFRSVPSKFPSVCPAVERTELSALQSANTPQHSHYQIVLLLLPTAAPLLSLVARRHIGLGCTIGLGMGRHSISSSDVISTKLPIQLLITLKGGRLRRLKPC